MNKQIRQILDRVYLYGMNGGLGYGKFTEELSPKEAEAKLQALMQDERLEAQLQILRGFRRRDFKLDAMYETAVLDRIDKLTKEIE